MVSTAGWYGPVAGLPLATYNGCDAALRLSDITKEASSDFRVLGGMMSSDGLFWGYKVYGKLFGNL
jgi:hypothetical protein